MIGVGIVAHTARVTAAKQLALKTRADFISFDSPHVGLGCDDNHTIVQQHLNALNTTWSVILEDDALAVENFRFHAKRALSLAPSPIVSFYLGKSRPPQHQAAIKQAILAADEHDAHWIIGSHLYHAVGYAIRTDLLASLLSFNSHLPSDQHITAWAQLHGHLISYTWPSYIDHADGHTLFTHPDQAPRPPGRVAHRFGHNPHPTLQAVTMGHL